MPTISAADLDTGRRHHLDRRAADLATEGAETGSVDELLSTSDVAEWLGISIQWLEIGRSKGYGPEFVRLSPRRVRYPRSAVLAWLKDRAHRSTAEYSTTGQGRQRGTRVVANRIVPPEAS